MRLNYPLTEIRSIRKRIKKTTDKLDDKLDTLKAKVNKNGHDSDSDDEKPKEKKQKKDVSNAKASGTNLALDGTPELFRVASEGSQKSKKSNASKTRRSSIPVFDPAAPALTVISDDDSDDEEDNEDEHAFDHPSTYVDQSWIWIPRDYLGLSEVLASDLKAVGVDASDVGATMDGQGIVEVTRNPPDEEWHGGHDG